jgi:ornithine cyclodeaminase/alanine dehydrogenase-like protein (mu-crystallin family)
VDEPKLLDRPDLCDVLSAASALSAQLLADPSSQTLLVFGTGTQAYYHARLILQLFPKIRTASCVVRKINERATSLVERLRDEFEGVTVRLATAEETQALVKEADIICG